MKRTTEHLKILLLIAGIIYLAYLTSELHSVNTKLSEQEKQIREMTLEQNSIHYFLLDQYGPCYGIPEGQCRE